MKSSAAFFLTAVLVAAADVPSDIFFQPPEPGTSVSFEGVTQAGKDVHRFEVRRLAYLHPEKKKVWPTVDFCVIYFAGGEYGPRILKEMQAIAPFVRRVGDDIVEVYFLAGAHTNVRQIWRLSGGFPTLAKEEEIEWKDDPRNKTEPNQALEPTSTAVTPPAVAGDRASGTRGSP